MIDVSNISDPEKLSNIIYRKNSSETERIIATQRLVDIYSPSGKLESTVRHRLRGIGLGKQQIPDDVREIALNFIAKHTLGFDYLLAMLKKGYPRKKDGTEFAALKTMQEELYYSIGGSDRNLLDFFIACDLDKRFEDYIAQKVLENPDAFQDATNALMITVRHGISANDETRVACLAEFMVRKHEESREETVAADVVRELRLCLGFDDPIIIKGMAKALVRLAEKSGIDQAFDELTALVTPEGHGFINEIAQIHELLPAIKTAAEAELSKKSNLLAKDGLALDGKIKPPEITRRTGRGPQKQPTR